MQIMAGDYVRTKKGKEVYRVTSINSKGVMNVRHLYWKRYTTITQTNCVVINKDLWDFLTRELGPLVAP